MQITMTDANVDVQPLPGGADGKMIVVVDKQGNVIIIPMPTASAKEVGMKLTTSLLIAGTLPPANGNGHGGSHVQR